jgi:signal transduction histidine kinase
VVVCTAYADYSWTEMVATLGRTDRLLILKKPFDAIEVCQLATAMTEKWNVTRRERERMQDALNAEREARAYAASLETVNRALEQAKVSADAAAKERAEFLVRMAGGILSPMSSLVDEAERVRRLGPPDEHWMQLVEHLCRDGQALTGSLQDVLDLTAMETGTLELERAACDPLGLAEQVVERARELVGERALELRVERGSRVPPAIETDAEHLERVLFHLVSNAITYTEQGSVVLRVEGQAGSSSRVTFAVADTGPGFSPEMRAHLFEPFCHAYTELHDERDGAGIGLYLSKRMARALGGDLALAPHPGPGSRLELSIDTALFTARTRSHG